MWSLALVALLSCGRDEPAPPRVEPQAVSTLAAVADGTTSVRLSWTAPEPGAGGDLLGYDLRMASTPLTEASFDSAETVVAPDPAEPGDVQEFRLAGLDPATMYHFALVTIGTGELRSGLSNVASAMTPAGADTIPPGPVTGFAATDSTATSVTLLWTVSGDDGGMGRLAHQELRYTTAPITAATWEAATPAPTPEGPLSPGSVQQVEVTGLPIRSAFHFAVRMVDEAGNSSPLPPALRATTRTVPRSVRVRVDGSGDFAGIQVAIDGSASGDTVLVEPGRYYENIDFSGKDLVIKGVAGAEVTIIDGSREANSVVLFKGTETRAAVLEGFTITGGRGYDPPPVGGNTSGGGIWTRSASAILRRLNVTDNHCNPIAFGTGGGIRLGWELAPLEALGHALIEECVISHNSTGGNGGGIAVSRTFVTIRNSTITDNSCRFDGGGIWLWTNSGGLDITDSDLSRNFAGDHGGGLYASNGTRPEVQPTVVARNLIYANRADGFEPHDTGSGGGIAVLDLLGTIARNTIVNNVGNNEIGCGGGGILLYDTRSERLAVRHNLIAFNTGCGISCRVIAGADIHTNLLWQNDTDIGDDLDPCPSSWSATQIVADPLFCGPDAGDYRVGSNSPALNQKEVIGAFSEPGCPAGSPGNRSD